jgi:hypothetical protein
MNAQLDRSYRLCWSGKALAPGVIFSNAGRWG